MAAKGKMNPMDRKFQNDQMKMNRIMNDDLVCKDCISKFPDQELPYNTSKCEKFPNGKPFEVLGGGECSEYKKE